MIYTVTLNPAIDKTVVIPEFAAGKVNRIQSVRSDPGGKGINVSKCLAGMGAGTTAAVLLGGSTGKKISQMLDQQGLSVLPVWIDGETRTNLKVVDPILHTNTDINEPGPIVTAGELERLKTEIGQRLKQGDVVILSGSLPRGADPATYRHWCSCFQEKGAYVYLDADGAAMQEGTQAVPWLIKPNDEELSRLVGKPLHTQEDLVRAGKALLEQGIREVVISLGAKGCLFLRQDGCWLADALDVPVHSTVGAGDSVVAAMAYSMEMGLGREDTIRLASAMGAASVMCDGTQAPEKELVLELAKQVKIHEV